MKTPTKFVAPIVAAAAIMGAVVLAPIAGADTDPLVPYGTNPHVSVQTGIHPSDHDEANTTNGHVDLPF